MVMKTVLIFLAYVLTFAGAPGRAHAWQPYSSSAACEGIASYASEMLAAQQTISESQESSGNVSQGLAALAETDWASIADRAESALATFKVIEPPAAVADWHAFLLEELAFRSAFGRMASANDLATASQTFEEARVFIATEGETRRDEAMARCPEFAEFYEQFLAEGFTDVAEDFFQRLVRGFEEQGFSLDPEARAVLATLAQRASDYLLTTPDPQSALDFYVGNASRLVDEVTAVTSAQGDTVVHAEGIRDKLKELCPFWPVC